MESESMLMSIVFQSVCLYPLQFFLLVVYFLRNALCCILLDIRNVRMTKKWYRRVAIEINSQ